MNESERAVWQVLVNACVRHRTGGGRPLTAEDRNEVVRPFLEDLKTDHAAIMAIAKQVAADEFDRIVSTVGDPDEV